MYAKPEVMPGERGVCVCLDCGTRVSGQHGVTCLEMNCPNCGAVLVRENSPYYRYVMQQWFGKDLEAALAFQGIETEPLGERFPVGADEGQGVLQGASAS